MIIGNHLTGIYLITSFHFQVDNSCIAPNKPYITFKYSVQVDEFLYKYITKDQDSVNYITDGGQ